MDDQPSNNWMDLSLLIGNEQLGAMIFGGIGRPYHLYFHDEITSFIVFVANVYNTILPQGILRHHLRRKILNTSDTLFRLQRSLTIMNGIFSVTQCHAYSLNSPTFIALPPPTGLCHAHAVAQPA